MKPEIKVELIDEDWCVLVGDKVVRKYNQISDDYCLTNAREYADKLEKDDKGRVEDDN